MGGASAGKFESRRFSGQISREIVKIFFWIFPCDNENNELIFFIFLLDSFRYQHLPRTFLLLHPQFLACSFLDQNVSPISLHLLSWNIFFLRNCSVVFGKGHAKCTWQSLITKLPMPLAMAVLLSSYVSISNVAQHQGTFNWRASSYPYFIQNYFLLKLLFNFFDNRDKCRKPGFLRGHIYTSCISMVLLDHFANKSNIFKMIYPSLALPFPPISSLGLHFLQSRIPGLRN